MNNPKKEQFRLIKMMRNVEQSGNKKKPKIIKSQYDLIKKVKLDPAFLVEMKKNTKKFPWKDVVKWQTLSSDLLDTLDDKIDWRLASEWQVLTEKQIRKHKKDIPWKNVVLYQSVSSDFLHKNIDRLPKFVQKKLRAEKESLIGNN